MQNYTKFLQSGALGEYFFILLHIVTQIRKEITIYSYDTDRKS